MTDSFPVLDTHTGGEITRILFADDIGLTGGSAAEQLQQLRDEFDWVRRSLTREPRGSEYAVGAVVRPPSETRRGETRPGETRPGETRRSETRRSETRPGDSGSIVFFNNVGYLGMCGHGLIGVVEALRFKGMITAGGYEFDTPAGQVSTRLGDDDQVSFRGVPSYCFRRDVAVRCDGGEMVTGDIAYGGNWFFLVADDSVQSGDLRQLTETTTRIRRALDEQQVRGADGALIDHVELYTSLTTTADEPQVRGCRNFVLCPGGHYDRSPCGTGTSAKLACLAQRGQLSPDTEWIQESVTGSRFTASYRQDGENVRVQICGRAHVIAETVQVFDPTDRLRFGIGGPET